MHWSPLTRVLFVILLWNVFGCGFLGEPPLDLGDALTTEDSMAACGTPEGPLGGSCLEGLGGDCWAPQGECSTVEGNPGAILTWGSGHSVLFAPELSDPDGLAITAKNSLGEECFRGRSSLNADGSGTVQFFEGLGSDAVLKGTLYNSSIGAVYVQCSGMSVALSPAEASVLEQCLYGRGGGLCNFAEASALFRASGAQQTGACGGAVIGCLR